MTKVVWSKRATKELESILDYWQKRNQSHLYSNKILVAADEAIRHISIHTNIGISTNHRKVKMRLILNRYYIVYRINQKVIEILKFWDCRKDPKSNPYFK